jgi:cytochrome b involved in lipid metabolism
MKQAVTISLLVFVAVIIIVFGGKFITGQNTQSGTQNTNLILSTTTDITLQDVAKHNTATNCWEIVNGKVYNVTDIITTHKNSSDLVIPYCGKDATAAYNNGNHSQRSDNKLAGYFVGNLK